MRLLGKILNILATGTYALCGLALLLFAIPDSGFTARSVQTGSMQPAISTGSLVIAQRTPLSQLQIGDVITFTSGKNTVTHRIVSSEIKAGIPFFTTKGDANEVVDQQIVGGRVQGKVIIAMPLVGYAVDFMRSIYGLALAIYLPALVVVIGELRRLAAYYRTQVHFRLPWVNGEMAKPRTKDKLAAGAQVSFIVVAVAAGVAVPVLALFTTNWVTLASNSISVAGPDKRILFRRIEFQCSDDNTGQVNKLPSIIFYNPADEDTSTGNWYVQSSTGRLVTFRPQTVFDAQDDYDIEPDLQHGVAYGGDFLALFNAENQLVDAISWGSDITHLNPSLPGIQDGSLFRRIHLVENTNTAADWSVSVEPCAVSE